MNDPAVLFYTSDFLTGVIDMTMEERGQYITLLCYQHQKGHISLETIRLLVGNVSVKVLEHFRLDENGLYFNARMDKEKESRQKFTESRRKNGKKGGRPKKEEKPSAKPSGKPKNNLMGNEDEDDNENININRDYILDLYSKTINNNISSIEYEKLNNYLKKYKEDLRIIAYAIEYCKMYKAYSINYLCKILSNWQKLGFRTLEEVKEHEKLIKEEREDVELFEYDWLNDEE